MATPTKEELQARLVAALRPDAKLTRHQTAAEMTAVRTEAAAAGIDYDALVIAACKQLKAEKTSPFDRKN